MQKRGRFAIWKMIDWFSTKYNIYILQETFQSSSLCWRVLRDGLPQRRPLREVLNRVGDLRKVFNSRHLRDLLRSSPLRDFLRNRWPVKQIFYRILDLSNRSSIGRMKGPLQNRILLKEVFQKRSPLKEVISIYRYSLLYIEMTWIRRPLRGFLNRKEDL